MYLSCLFDADDYQSDSDTIQKQALPKRFQAG